MTRSELIDHLHTRFPALLHADAKSVVTVILNAIAGHPVSGLRIEIRGFGSFELVYRKPRLERNPKSGEKVLVPGKYRAHVKARKEMRERMDFRQRDQKGRASAGVMVCSVGKPPWASRLRQSSV
jgi:integration host factor subunit beta